MLSIAPALRRTACSAAFLLGSAAAAFAEYTNNILITGFWPPTNDMIRPWNQDPIQNPGGWIGENWEGRGYDIYAYHPEFPGGVGQNPRGEGNMEVDY